MASTDSRLSSERLNFQRARDAGQKAERRDQILRAAAECLEQMDWDSLTMAAIADRAGLAKGTAYRYVATKEELFLHILLDELAEWSAQLEAEVISPGAAYEGFPTRFARSVAGRGRMLKLLGMLHTVLERNVTVDAAAAFKHRLLEILRRLGESMEAYDIVPHGSAMRYLMRAYALVVGLSQMANPSPPVAAAIGEDSELADFEIDFEAELRDCLEKLAD